MKPTTPEESAYILARLCSETTNNDTVKCHLRSSPTERGFRNRFVAVVIRRLLEALQTTASEFEFRPRDVLAANFEAAAKALEMRADDLRHRTPGRAGKSPAAKAALAFLGAVEDLARAYGAIRFDPYKPPPSRGQS